jgi:hypothetical protein
MSETSLAIELVDGSLAPRYEPSKVEMLSLDKAVITERGTEGGLPLVDFQMTSIDGKEYFFAVTGRLVLSLAAAIRGVNDRNHGVSEP